jgi:hypothetical protein
MFQVLTAADIAPREMVVHLLMVMLWFCHRLVHRQQQESQYSLVPWFSPDQVTALLEQDGVALFSMPSVPA